MVTELFVITTCLVGTGCKQSGSAYISGSSELQQIQGNVENYIQIYAEKHTYVANAGTLIGLFASQSLQFRYNSTNILLKPKSTALQWSF